MWSADTTCRSLWDEVSRRDKPFLFTYIKFYYYRTTTKSSATCRHVLTVLRKFPTSKTVQRMSRMVRQFRRSTHNTIYRWTLHWLRYQSDRNYTRYHNMNRFSVWQTRKAKQEVWPPGSADTVCPRPPLMIHVQQIVSRIKKRQRWDVQTMWAYDLDQWPWIGGHSACGWCGSSSSIRIPSLKFTGLAIRKIWRTMCVSINGPGGLDLETGMRVASKVGNLPSAFGHARPFASRIIRYVRDGRTDHGLLYINRGVHGQTDGRTGGLTEATPLRRHNKAKFKLIDSWTSRGDNDGTDTRLEPVNCLVEFLLQQQRLDSQPITEHSIANISIKHSIARPLHHKLTSLRAQTHHPISNLKIVTKQWQQVGAAWLDDTISCLYQLHATDKPTNQRTDKQTEGHRHRVKPHVALLFV